MKRPCTGNRGSARLFVPSADAKIERVPRAQPEITFPSSSAVERAAVNR